MSIQKISRLPSFLHICFFIFILCCTVASQETDVDEYHIGPGDLLEITFWQKPEFNAEARVSATGLIEVPLIGSLMVDGLTTKQLRDTIEGRISLLDAKISQVSVGVKEYGSKVVYVTGGVVAPGKYYFEFMPNIWQIILEAGGPATSAQLDNVAIVHSGGAGQKGQILYVNVAEALESGDLSAFPDIYPGDTINIPSTETTGEGGASGSTVSSPLQQRSVVYVWGAVGSPGVFNIQKDMDILEAIIQAGGPADKADLKQVRIYFRGVNQAEMAVIDMEKYTNRSYPLPLKVHSGDAIFIPRKEGVFRSTLNSLFSTLLYVGIAYLFGNSIGSY